MRIPSCEGQEADGEQLSTAVQVQAGMQPRDEIFRDFCCMHRGDRWTCRWARVGTDGAGGAGTWGHVASISLGTSAWGQSMGTAARWDVAFWFYSSALFRSSCRRPWMT